nr:MAG: ORF1 [TTV-like mini virus]
MPPFRRRWYFQRNYYRRRPWRPRRRRPWHRRRRPRKTIFRKFRRRRWVRKNFFKKKLKKIKLAQWQPNTIKNCSIKGYKCLFWAGPSRASNNYAQYQETFINPHQPGGGGWSYLIFNLAALWEEHQKCRNWWTKGNQGLPLTRYMGCKFKFFRDLYTSYAVHYSLCYPMLDAPLVHANSSPFHTILTKRRFIVPSMLHKPKGKRYIKKHFKPPSQLLNKWYFQQDLCTTGLLLLQTTAVDLDHFYLPTKAINNNISIYTLNPKIFQHNGYQQILTNGYSPKTNYYLYINNTHEIQVKVKQLTYLGKPGPFTLGTSYENTPQQDQQNYTNLDKYWGNPFHPDVLEKNKDIYVSTVQPREIFNTSNLNNTAGDTTSKLVKVTEDFILELRYNPDRDTGQDNVAYLITNTKDTNFNIPNDDNIVIQGFPLYILLWSWLDWQKKLAYIHNIDQTYQLIIKTKFTEPKVDYIIPIDYNFTQGIGPYGLPQTEWNTTTKTTWYPKCAHQLVTIDNICMCGPATPKYNDRKNIQAHCFYNFKFKWGGCPAPMVNLTNPCLQPKYPMPGTVIQGLQIQNPAYPPQLELHQFDERQSQLTKKCLKRIQDYTETEQTIQCVTGPTIPPTTTKRQRLQKALQTSESETEEETETLQQQLNKLRNRQILLKQSILQLMKPDIE